MTLRPRSSFVQFAVAVFVLLIASYAQAEESHSCFRNEIILNKKFKGYSASALPSSIALKEDLGLGVLAAPTDRKVEASKSSVKTTCSATSNSCRRFERHSRRLGLKARIAAHHYSCSENYEVTASRTPNDSFYSLEWGLNQPNNMDIDAPEAWDTTTGSSSTIIGVIDTGIQYNHPDLSANIWTNPGEVAGNGIDDDDNGYIDDVHGINAITNTGDPLDDNGHGTHVAGTIGAQGNNSAGVVGVNWTVRMIGCKFLAASGSGSTSDAVKCIAYFNYLRTVKNIPVVLTNNSWGGGGSSTAVENAIEAAKTAGILFIASAGNSNQNIDTTPSYPASYTNDNIISVAAIDSNGDRASFSNYGVSAVDIAAPGVSIASTYPYSPGHPELGYQFTYVYLSGTSMASPHVSGAVALLSSHRPDLSWSQLKSITLQNTKPLNSMSGLVATGGLLNVNNMFIAAGAVATATPTNTPSQTSTPVPTATPVNTATPVPTATQAPVPTNTPVPTVAPQPTNTPLPTNTPVPTMTPTPLRTSTPTPRATNTRRATATPTRRPTKKPTRKPTPKPKPKKDRRERAAKGHAAGRSQHVSR